MKGDPSGFLARYAPFVLGLVAVLLGALFFGGYRYRLLAVELEEKKIELASTTVGLARGIDSLKRKLSGAEGENARLNSSLVEEKGRNDLFQNQIGALSNTVGTLKKLSETDKELLQKYSKVYFLNEHYVPQALAALDPAYLEYKDRIAQVHEKAVPFLRRLLSDARGAGVNIEINSAYRSFGAQSSLKSTYKILYGAGTANQFSADQGYSEHQLGTAVDFSAPSVGGSFDNFEKSREYAWLTENAYKYGFTLSYPKGNAYYHFEPWHWRFVGNALAGRLRTEQKYFYDLIQRDIDQYLVNIFD